MKLIDLTGKRFGRLTVLGRSGTSNKQPAWKCLCDCGGTAVVVCGKLRDGETRSCGCLVGETRAAKNHKHGHAKSQSTEYTAWKGMHARCRPGSRWTHYYADRGISVCERWRDFETFLSDMGARPADKTSLDRIDNNGNYEPGNCRWATASEQALNRRPKTRAA